jgi:Uma2 family endonuclease
MSVLTITSSEAVTLADLLAELGNIPPKRVRLRPLPGTATERDVLEVYRHEKRLCELVDGVLVEKAMGFRESILAVVLIRMLDAHVHPRNLGLVTAPDGMMRLSSGLIRIPDVAFISWDRIPARKVPDQPIPSLSPDLAVEILSEGNTPAEMDRKCAEYFAAGTSMVWLVDPDRRTIAVYTAVNQSRSYRVGESIDAGPVLPGFILPLQNLFAELDRQGNEQSRD